MKVAICGGGLHALEMASFLIDQGANVKIFSPVLGGSTRSLAEELYDESLGLSELNYKWEELTTRWGRQRVGLNVNLANEVKLKEFYDAYLLPLVESLYPFHRQAKVLRTHKRYLSKNESIENHSRVYDLFRVVYEVNARNVLEEQKSQSPESFEKLSPEILESLSETYEGFEDFDFVVEATGHYYDSKSMGPGGNLALNERVLSKDLPIYYGLGQLKEFLDKKEVFKRIAIIGSGEVASFACLKLQSWLEAESQRVLYVVTTEQAPFQKIISSSSSQSLKSSIINFLKAQKENFEKQIKSFEEKISEWKSFEPHVRVKKNRPSEPMAQFDIFTGTNVTSLDRLIDREGIFLTLEAPDFRGHNLQDPLKTIGVDAVFVATGHEKSFDLKGDEFIFNEIKGLEEGYYYLNLNKHKVSSLDHSIQEIFEDMKNYFKKAE